MMFRNVSCVLLCVLAMIGNLSYGQEDSLAPDTPDVLGSSGIRVVLIPNIEIDSVTTNFLVADFSDTRLPYQTFDLVLDQKLDLLTMVAEKTDMRIVLIIGNTTCNIKLSDYAMAISKIENLDELVLDSVDTDDVSLSIIRERRPKLSIVFSEHSAMEGIRSSIRVNNFVSAFAEPVQLDGRPEFDLVPKVHTSTFSVFAGSTLAYPSPRPITPGTLHYFRHLRHLTEVRWENVEAHDCDLRYLTNCSNLKILRIDNTPIDGSGLTHISRTLTELTAYSTANLKSIPFKRFPELSKLVISSKKIPEAELMQIAHCKKLREVHASGTRLTPKSLIELLKDLPSLKYISVTHDGNDSESIAELRRQWNGKVSIDGQTLILDKREGLRKTPE